MVGDCEFKLLILSGGYGEVSVVHGYGVRNPFKFLKEFLAEFCPVFWNCGIPGQEGYSVQRLRGSLEQNYIHS